jgi:hypothetical protein
VVAVQVVLAAADRKPPVQAELVGRA